MPELRSEEDKRVDDLIADLILLRRAVKIECEQIEAENRVRVEGEKRDARKRLEGEFAVKLVRARSEGVPLKRLQNDVLRSRTWSVWARWVSLAKEKGVV